MPDLKHRNLAAQTTKGAAALAPARATTAQLAAIADPINTRGKVAGKLVINTTTNILVHAASNTAAGIWYNAGTGVAAHTPA